jgi:hypothetical protein
MSKPTTLVPDAEVRKEFKITAMTLWRWDHDPDLGFPPPAIIRGRKYRSRALLDAFNQTLIEQALANRKPAA